MIWRVKETSIEWEGREGVEMKLSSQKEIRGKYLDEVD
jgi:hypothetical protein